MGNPHLPLLMQNLLNTPLCVAPSYAAMMVAALNGRLDISSLQIDDRQMGREEMEALAARGRVDADAKRADRKSGTIIDRVGNVAVIQVWGTLTRTWGVGPYSGSTGYDGILMQLEDAIKDEDIKGIWLDIDSGGGTVNGLFDLVDTIFSFRSRNGGPKPIYAMCADYAYSAAFAIGTAADKLFVPPTGGAGSVGVITLHASYKEALENEGIKVTVIREPEDKAKGTEFEDLDAETESQIRAQCKEIADIFQDKVARNMGISKASVAATKGLDYMGRHAKAIGFVSDVLPEPLAWAKLQRRISR